jgi:Protein of unknown function VcgC/VcgE (DUF2780)
MNPTKTLRIRNVAVCLFAIAFGILAQAQVPATSGSKTPNAGLVSHLTSQLNITPEQGVGGTGAIFGLAKSRLNPAEFSKLAAAVPGMDGFLKAAPRLLLPQNSQGPRLRQASVVCRKRHPHYPFLGC